MPRPIRNLKNMEIDEISLVDKGANQHAMITIAKRAPEEDEMPEFDIYNEDGEVLSEDDLNVGDIVYDEDGAAYEFVGDEENAEEREPETVGKSAFFEDQSEPSSFSKEIMEELSKAFSDDDRDAVIAKALGRVQELENAHNQYAEIAKAERDLRLTREYISKAEDYNLPVDPQELGPVLYRMAETMDYDDCAVIAKCLEAAGTMLFEEAGFQGSGENADPMAVVEAYANENIEKSNGVSREAMISKVFDENPAAYDEYLSERRGI
jgi:hypothetical protein